MFDGGRQAGCLARLSVNVGASFPVSGNTANTFLSSSHLVDIIPGGTGTIPFLTYPVTFNFHFEATLYNGVTGQFGKRTLGELVYLYAVIRYPVLEAVQISHEQLHYIPLAEVPVVTVAPINFEFTQ